MRVLDLFSGIGGFSLGLERAGMTTVAFCEIEPYCRAVLAKHWPDIPCFGDIRGIDGVELGRLGGPIDVICGGFPCQDISLAGAGAGITGPRSGLWSEYARVIGLVRPQYVIVENVSALLGRGLGTVLGDLAALGYDAEWHCIPAAYVGAPHRRDRIWIVAYPNGEGEHDGTVDAEVAQPSQSDTNSNMQHDDDGRSESSQVRREQRRQSAEISGWKIFADSDGSMAHAHRQPSLRFTDTWAECDYWIVEPDVGRVANGIPSRVDRLKALGNAVVPQIPEIIGAAIMKLDSEHAKGVKA